MQQVSHTGRSAPAKDLRGWTGHPQAGRSFEVQPGRRSATGVFPRAVAFRVSSAGEVRCETLSSQLRREIVTRVASSPRRLFIDRGENRARRGKHRAGGRATSRPARRIFNGSAHGADRFSKGEAWGQAKGGAGEPSNHAQRRAQVAQFLLHVSQVGDGPCDFLAQQRAVANP